MALDFIFKRHFLATFYVHICTFTFVHSIKVAFDRSKGGLSLHSVQNENLKQGKNGISRLNVGKFLIDKKIV